MLIGKDFKTTLYLRFLLRSIPAQLGTNHIGHFFDQGQAKFSEVGQERAAQQQVIQVNDFFSLDQELDLATRKTRTRR